jgi:AraC-like DNA-binding protein
VIGRHLVIAATFADAVSSRTIAEGATGMDVHDVEPTVIQPVVDNAAVVHANHHQFAATDHVEYPLVMSRALVWCIAGRGEIVSRGQTFAIFPTALLVLPWRHDILYLPDPTDPFLLGTVHLIPDHGHEVEITPLPRYGGSGRSSVRYRRDVAWPGFDEPRLFSGRSSGPLVRLGEVAIEQLPEWDCNQVVMRALGVLLSRAVIGLETESQIGQRMPLNLIRMQEYARSHLYKPLTTSTLADIGKCSVSTAERQFRRYTGLSPMSWLKEERLQLAARLLRTSNRRVGEISSIAGFRDSFYFARIFRSRFGASPRNFSRRYSTPVVDGAPPSRG